MFNMGMSKEEFMTKFQNDQASKKLGISTDPIHVKSNKPYNPDQEVKDYFCDRAARRYHKSKIKYGCVHLV